MIFDKHAGSACLEMNRSNIAPLWNLFLGQPRFLGKCDITLCIPVILFTGLRTSINALKKGEKVSKDTKKCES